MFRLEILLRGFDLMPIKGRNRPIRGRNHPLFLFRKQSSNFRTSQRILGITREKFLLVRTIFSLNFLIELNRLRSTSTYLQLINKCFSSFQNLLKEPFEVKRVWLHARHQQQRFLLRIWFQPLIRHSFSLVHSITNGLLLLHFTH